MSYYTRLITFVSGGKLPASDLNAEFDAVKTGIDAIEADVDAAALSVTTAGSNTTSTTSNNIGTGSKTWTVQADKSLVVGMTYKMAETATPSNWMLGTITAYNSTTGSLSITVTDISGSGSNITAWTGSVSAPITRTMTRRAITTTDTVASSDHGGLIDITSGTFTLSYTAAATLGSGFWCVVRNSGTGDVTHDPASSETIDGLTSFVMYPGESRLVQCNGTAFYSIVLSGFNKTFTATGTFTKPPGYQRFAGQLWGGGGGGRKDTGSGQCYGGGGGACALFDIPASSFGTTETITIGAGGAGQTSTANGGDGGNSSVGTLVNAYGGEGGLASTSNTAGGSAYFADRISIQQNNYIGGLSNNAAIMPAQTVLGGGAVGNAGTGNTVYGGAGGGTVSSTPTVYNPATYSTTVFGGAGGNASIASSGSDGVAPGGGGGATHTGTTSGAGARGELRIWGIV